jgi:hypothetical protein
VPWNGGISGARRNEAACAGSGNSPVIGEVRVGVLLAFPRRAPGKKARRPLPGDGEGKSRGLPAFRQDDRLAPRTAGRFDSGRPAGGRKPLAGL